MIQNHHIHMINIIDDQHILLLMPDQSFHQLNTIKQMKAKQQQLKLTPITEVKRYLIKNGFIKVGSTTPNDVLRKMFESALMLCGEVKNHNSENLLFNYMNSEE